MLCILNVGTVPTLCILNVGTVPMLCFLNVGTVPTLYILNVGTVPTFSHSLNKNLNLRSKVHLTAYNVKSFAIFINSVSLKLCKYNINL